MANFRQSILIRTDLNLPAGLLAAQVAHIHFEYCRQQLRDDEDPCSTSFREWMESPYLFVHRVPNLEALSYFKVKAVEAKLPVAEWKDTVYQDLAPDIRQPFNLTVGISIGPADSDAIKMVIGSLPLL